MMIPWDMSGGYKPVPYSSLKAKKFKQNKEKVRGVLMSIQDTKLKQEDKMTLLKEIREMVNLFEIK